MSTHASRSTSRRGAVLERLGPFGAACFSQGRVVDHRRALAGSQRACDASQQSACICVGSVCSGAPGHFSAKRVIRFLQRRACAEGFMCRMGLSSLQRCKNRVLEICVPPLRKLQLSCNSAVTDRIFASSHRIFVLHIERSHLSIGTPMFRPKPCHFLLFPLCTPGP